MPELNNEIDLKKYKEGKKYHGDTLVGKGVAGIGNALNFVNPFGRKNRDNRKANISSIKASSFLNSAKRSVRPSKITRVNYMSIPRLQAAQRVLDGKLKKQNLDEHMVNKLTDLKNEYVNTERQINKYYQKVSTNPLTAGMLRGQRNLLTIAGIKNGKFRGHKKDKDISYGKVDFLRDIRADKIAMGVGVAAMAAGTATAIIGQDTIANWITNTLANWIQANPVAVAMLGSGAALIAAAKIIPAIDRKARKVRQNKAAVNAAQNALSEEASTHERNIDDSALFMDSEKFKTAKVNGTEVTQLDNLAQAFVDNPNLKQVYLKLATTGKRPDGQLLTSQQKLNILQAIQKASQLEAQVKAAQGEVKPARQPKKKTTKAQEQKGQGQQQVEEESEFVNPNNAADVSGGVIGADGKPKTPKYSENVMRCRKELANKIKGTRNLTLFEKVLKDSEFMKGLTQEEKTQMEEIINTLANAEKARNKTVQKGGHYTQTKEVEELLQEAAAQTL